ncbi:MAG: ribosomal RNA small subunit methyltransferase A [Promethearchaeota archaeon]|nr:MAG: ribosomal RNA small subunit methyltransferase A [Candidatus Lokiarchaeota archaeon]
MKLRDVKLILNKLGVSPDRRLGQNFLIDNNIIKKIITKSELLKDDIILEIGPGLGALTEKLVEKVKKVYAIEIDPRLCSYLEKKFLEYDNIDIINADILNLDLPIHNKVVSNIPYSITGPIFEKIFYNSNPPEGIMIIEKKIVDRIFYNGNYENFSRITVSFNAFMKLKNNFFVSRNCFFPIPNIDLSLIKISPREEINQFLLNDDNKNFFLKFIAGIMPYKNKNLLNALELFLKNNKIIKFNKLRINQILQTNKYNNIKVFRLKIEEFIELSKLFSNLNEKI